MGVLTGQWLVKLVIHKHEVSQIVVANHRLKIKQGKYERTTLGDDA